MMPTNQFNFWHKFLFAISLLIVLTGLFIAFFNQSEIFNYVFNKQINPIFGLEDNLSSGIMNFQSWIYGVLGVTMSGWGIFFLFIIQNAFKQKQKWAWYCIAVGISIWYITDTAISIYFNVWFNALFNTVLFLLIIIPLMFTKKYF